MMSHRSAGWFQWIAAGWWWWHEGWCASGNCSACRMGWECTRAHTLHFPSQSDRQCHSALSKCTTEIYCKSATFCSTSHSFSMDIMSFFFPHFCLFSLFLPSALYTRLLSSATLTSCGLTAMFKWAAQRGSLACGDNLGWAMAASPLTHHGCTRFCFFVLSLNCRQSLLLIEYGSLISVLTFFLSSYFYYNYYLLLLYTSQY